MLGEGSAELGPCGESSLALTSVGSGSPTRGESLLRWTNPQDSASMLFTLDDAAESMERESLNVGIISVLEALNHATGALRDVIVPSGRVFLHPASLPLSSFFYFLYPDHNLSVVPHSSQPGKVSVPSSTEGDLGPPRRGGMATWGGDCSACCRLAEGG